MRMYSTYSQDTRFSTLTHSAMETSSEYRLPPKVPNQECHIEDVESKDLNHRQGQWLSRHDKMILEIDKRIPSCYNILAGFLSWLLLAGFLVSPSAYASMQESSALQETGQVGRSVMQAVRNVPLLFIASFACLIASAGLAWLWWRWRHNYILINRYVIV